MSNIRISLVVLCGLLISLTASADTFVRTDSQFELPQNQTIEGNFLGVGNPVSVAGEVVEDATLVGNRVTVSGIIGEDVLALGILAQLDGVIRDDARIISGNTTVTGTIEGDLLVVGGSVDVLSDAVIAGDLLVYAGTANISGSVGGDVIGTTQNMTVDGPVTGSLDVHVAHLTLGSNASITESVRYTSNSLLVQSIETTIGGTVLRNDPVFVTGGFSLSAAVYPVLILLFSTFVWYTMSRRTLDRLITRTVRVLPRSAITGVVSLFVTPLIIFVLTVSLLGGYLWVVDMSASASPLAFSIAVLPVLIALFGFLTLFLLAIVAVPAFFGHLCMFVSKNGYKTTSAMSIMIGALVCVILLLLPVFGMFIFFFVAVTLLGGLLEGLIKASR